MMNLTHTLAQRAAELDAPYQALMGASHAVALLACQAILEGDMEEAQRYAMETALAEARVGMLVDPQPANRALEG